MAVSRCSMKAMTSPYPYTMASLVSMRSAGPKQDDTIESLSKKIVENTNKIASYLRSQQLPFPSFGVDAPSTSPVPPEAKEIEKAKLEVANATRKLQALMLGPKASLQTFAHNDLLSMQAIIRFKIASSFPINGEASYGEIAKKCGLGDSQLRRVLRHAIMQSIFREPREGFVAHTAASKMLAEDREIRESIGKSTDELLQAATQQISAAQNKGNAELWEDEEQVYQYTNEPKKYLHEGFESDSERGKRFENAVAA